MGHSAEEYKGLLKSLLPKGRAWTRAITATIDQLLYGMAEELARVETRGYEFLTEAYPSLATEMITEHETEYGIPEYGQTLRDNISERRADIVAKLVSRGQQDKEYFIFIAEKLMYIAIIEEYRPAWSGVVVSGEACGPQLNLFFWKMRADINEQKGDFSIDFAPEEFTSLNKDDIAYVIALTRKIDTLIFRINQIKPGHTMALYDFYNVEYSRGFYWSFDAMPIHDGLIPFEMLDVGFGIDFASVGNYDGTYLNGSFAPSVCLSFDRMNGGAFLIDGFSAEFSAPR